MFRVGNLCFEKFIVVVIVLLLTLLLAMSRWNLYMAVRTGDGPSYFGKYRYIIFFYDKIHSSARDIIVMVVFSFQYTLPRTWRTVVTVIV